MSEKPPVIPPSPRGILKTAASRAAKKAAQHAAQRAALLERRPLVFRVLLLGGPGCGKSALLRAAAGERLGAPELSRYAPTLAPQSATFYAAVCKGRAVYLQLWDVPFALLAADAAAARRGDSSDARFPAAAHLDMLLASAHAAVLVADAREGADARAAAVAFPSFAAAARGVWAGGSLDAVDLARGVLARAEVKRAAAVAAAAGGAGAGAGAPGEGCAWDEGAAELRCADAADGPAAPRAPPMQRPWRAPQPHALPQYLLMHKADHYAALAASLAAVAAPAAPAPPPPPPPPAGAAGRRLSGVLEDFFGAPGAPGGSGGGGGGGGGGVGAPPTSAWASSSAAAGGVDAEALGVPYLTFRGGGALSPRDVAAYAAGGGLRGWGWGSVLLTLEDAPSPRAAGGGGGGGGGIGGGGLAAGGGGGGALLGRARAPSLGAISSAPSAVAELAEGAVAAAAATATATAAAAAAAAPPAPAGPFRRRGRLSGRSGAAGGAGAGGVREGELARLLGTLVAREASDAADADKPAVPLREPAASVTQLLHAIVDDLLERHVLS